MCDYSIESYNTRLALDGEALVIHQFRSGSIGMADPREKPWMPPILMWLGYALDGLMSHWLGVQSALSLERRRQRCAICIPPGAQLVLYDIPANLQHDLGVGETERVEFIQTSARAYTYRDGVRFANGKCVLLQALSPGQRVDVVSVMLTETPATTEELALARQ